MLRNFFNALLFYCLCSTTLLAGGPENAVIVVNSESASSKLVANFYIHKRKIPECNVIYLSGIPRGETILLEDFKKKILSPLLEEIDARKISGQVDYIVYSSGFPTRVDGQSVRQKMRTSDNAGLVNLAKSRTSKPILSLNSATFYYQSILTDQYDVFLNLTSNYYYRGKTQSTLTRPFVGKDQAKFLRATRFARLKRLSDAIRIMKELADKHPLQMSVHYWLARLHAQDKNSDAACQAMKTAIQTGWQYQEYARSDAALSALKDDERFQDVLNSIPDFSFHQLASQSFQSPNIWGYNGSVNSTLDQGRRYLLSTLLSVTRNQGISEQESLDYLETSISSDATRPQGTIYFTKTKDVRTQTRFPNFKDTMIELKQLGYSSEIFIGRHPLKRKDVLGLMMGTPKYEWEHTGSKIVPGAICDNLTSYGGWLEPGIGQTKLSKYLQIGAAGSSGTVCEPFALQVKFPHPRLHVHYLRGCTLAESFYQAVHGPFQLLIVGDALCRPFAKIPRVTVSGEMADDIELNGKTSVTVDTNQSPVEIRLTEVFVDGRRMIGVEDFGDSPFALDTTTLSDGYHEFRFVPVAAGSIATKGSTIVPVVVNNHGHSVSLTSTSSNADVNSNITFEFDASGAKEVRLVHNYRPLAISKRSKGTFNIRAFELGRGTVSLRAVADFDGSYVSSKPFSIKIDGPISTNVPTIKSAPKPRASKQTKKTSAKKSNATSKDPAK